MVAGIYVAATLTTLFVVAVYGIVVLRLSQREDRRALLVAALVALPLQPVLFYLLRLPLDAALRGALGTGILYGWLTTFYAPLTEEPAKWLPLALPLVRSAVAPRTVVPLALAIGLGFGLGELWFLAEQVGRVPAYASLPFWAFGGFAIERFYVTFLHGGFVLFVIAAVAAGRSPLRGALLGMVLHYAVNAPIFLAGIDAFGLGPAAWTAVATLFPTLVALVLALAMGAMAGRTRKRTGDKPGQS